uniref:Uncharacterized protein n=1 Tax=Anguilla anguilla TaxID=7936 RepID=A0A0E9SUZ6_ANGAN
MHEKCWVVRITSALCRVYTILNVLMDFKAWKN